MISLKSFSSWNWLLRSLPRPGPPAPVNLSSVHSRNHVSSSSRTATSLGGVLVLSILAAGFNTGYQTPWNVESTVVFYSIHAANALLKSATWDPLQIIYWLSLKSPQLHQLVLFDSFLPASWLRFRWKLHRLCMSSVPKVHWRNIRSPYPELVVAKARSSRVWHIHGPSYVVW